MCNGGSRSDAVAGRVFSAPMNRNRFESALKLGIAAQQARQIPEALAHYNEAVSIAPNDPEALSLLGLALTQSGRMADGMGLLRQAVGLNPRLLALRFNLVDGLEAAGEYGEAIGALHVILADDPGNVRAWLKAGDIGIAQRDLDGAAVAWQRAHDLQPDAAGPVVRLARLALARERPAEALRALDSVTSVPEDVDWLVLRCQALAALQLWPMLEESALAWLDLQPGNRAGWYQLSRAAFGQGRHRAAAEAYARGIELGTPTAADYTALAGLLLHARDVEAAGTALARAVVLDPRLPAVLAMQALLHMYHGRFDAAEDSCRRCLASEPENVDALTILDQLHEGDLPEADFTAAARIAGQPEAAADRRIAAAFVVAHVLDARGDTDAAFAACGTAHQLCLARDRHEGRGYDRGLEERRFARIIELFPAPAAPATPRAAAQGAPRPIFVLGMPRSGTTLIESVLAAHSRVRAFGERNSGRRMLRTWLDLDEQGEAADEDTLGRWAAAYFAELPALDGADHVTDKQPLNFEAIGLIARLFPDAAIVHVRRSPLETCLSIHRQPLGKAWSFAHSLADIGHYYGLHARLMNHWERQFPGLVTTIEYEAFAGDFAQAAPALLRACGLEWEPQCLEFQRSPQPITTPAAVQARGPVVPRQGRAARYQRHLADLVGALEAAGVDPVTGKPAA